MSLDIRDATRSFDNAGNAGTVDAAVSLGF
jgi:hypothetical protein